MPEDMALYMRERYANNRKAALEYLGGECVRCGSVEQLEFDHIDRTTKEYTIGSNVLYRRLENIKDELDKCQLLCKPCHDDKGHEVGDIGVAEHGHITMWKNHKCHCLVCNAARKTFNKEYRKKRRESSSVVAASDS